MGIVKDLAVAVLVDRQAVLGHILDRYALAAAIAAEPRARFRCLDHGLLYRAHTIPLVFVMTMPLWCAHNRHTQKGNAMILAVGNTKGGVGKTTLALNLSLERARHGCDVLFIDADEQRTATDFFALRAERLGDTGVTHAALSGLAVRRQTERMAPKYDETVIDVGGRDTTALRAALVVADVALIPSQPRSFDLWALEIMAGLVREASAINARLRAYAVLCRADPQGGDNAEAARTLAALDGVAYLDAPIVARKAWANSASLGLGVAEPDRCDVKARNELWACIAALYDVDPFSLVQWRGAA